MVTTKEDYFKAKSDYIDSTILIRKAIRKKCESNY
jgi:hypothetical protein